MRYCVVNLGCKVNRVESDLFERTFHDMGYVASFVKDADVIVVNTCTVTSEAEKKARKLVRSTLRENDHAPVVVTGCASAMAPSVFEEMSARVKVVGKADVERYMKDSFHLDACSTTFDSAFDPACDSSGDPERNLAEDVFCPSRSRVGVKIQDGCNNECTYCIVCKARGASLSIPVDGVLAQVADLIDLKIPEILLTGIDLGAYRSDGLELSGLLELLRARFSYGAEGSPAIKYVSASALSALQTQHARIAPFKTRFRISSIEPKSISDVLIEQLATSDGAVCRHLHIPLQSGSAKVLSEMARNYTLDEYISLIEKIRTAIPSIAITTDIIVGFPGESEADFADTLEVAQKCAFSNIHVFPYSKRAGTVAAQRSDQVEPEIKSERARKLRELALDLRNQDKARRIGTFEVFCVQEDAMMMSESYYEVVAPKNLPAGSLVEMQFC